MPARPVDANDNGEVGDNALSVARFGASVGPGSGGAASISSSSAVQAATDETDVVADGAVEAEGRSARASWSVLLVPVCGNVTRAL